MEYVGLQTQIWRNNTRSIILLIAFPVVLLGLTWAFFAIIETQAQEPNLVSANYNFLSAVPFVAIAVGIWFLISWFGHSSMIMRATGSKPLDRKSNKRVYNLVENLCIAEGMKTPKIHIIEDSSLNAFASGINDKTYAVSLSRGIIEKLDDDELEGVIAHELTHIQNRDVRLLIISIIFVGVFAFIAEAAFRATLYGRAGRGKKDGGGAIILIMVLGLVGYLISLFLRFGISRKREYMADAGAAQMTKKPEALANALRKISGDPKIEAVTRDDVAQLFIEHPKTKKKGLAAAFAGLFATHPPIDARIQVLEQF